MTRDPELKHARRLTPPISALAAFEAVARHGSFTLAANELALTQSAVSRQIGALEGLLGVALFEGNRRKKIALTPSGTFYAERVRQMLSNLVAATTETIALGGGGSALRLGIPPTCGSRWLIPRMPGFFAAHPDISVEFSTRVPGRPGSGLENLDAMIDFVSEPNAYPESCKLLELDLLLVATPRIKRQLAHPAKTPLQNLQILVHRVEQRTLPDVLSGSTPWPLPRLPTLTFESYLMLFQAARAELGIGVAPKVFIESELSSGTLVPVSDRVIRSKRIGYLVFTPEKAAYPPLVAFRQWLFESANTNRA